MSLPIYQTPFRDLSLMQTNWAAQINPVLNNILVQGNLLKSISLINGAVTINHKLSRMMQGWMIVDTDAPATVYRSQPLNDQTLTLTSNAAATVSLWVF